MSVSTKGLCTHGARVGNDRAKFLILPLVKQFVICSGTMQIILKNPIPLIMQLVFLHAPSQPEARLGADRQLGRLTSLTAAILVQEAEIQ